MDHLDHLNQVDHPDHPDHLDHLDHRDYLDHMDHLVDHLNHLDHLDHLDHPGASAGFFQGGGQIFFVGGLSRFIGLRVHHNYGLMAIGYFMPRK